MADDPEIPPPDSPPPQLNQLVDELVDQVYDVKKLTRWEKLIGNAIKVAGVAIVGAVFRMAGTLGAFIGTIILKSENENQDTFNELARVAILDMFNVNIDVNATRGQGGNQAAADAIGSALFAAFSGQAGGGSAPGEGGLQPSDAPAKAFLSAMSQMALEGWLMGVLAETFSFGQLETFGELDDTLSHVLGLGRASAAVHGPLVRHLIVEPLEWKVNIEHRPSLLSPSTVARQWARGKWDWPDVQDELARQGWSEERIDAIINEARRFISLDDVGRIAHRVDTATFDPKAYLADMGYGQSDADAVLLAQSIARLDAREKQLADVLVASLVAGDITPERFTAEIDRIQLPAEDADHYKRLAALRVDVALTPLSDGDARAAVQQGIQTYAWYRDYLARRGFDQNGIDTKELLLRLEINADADAARAKAEQAADRAAAKAESDAARAARIAEKARADALPAYSEVRRAFVRGLVPVERFTQAVADAHPGIAPADAAALLADAQADRDAYVAQQAAHAAALARDTDPALPLATLERSVLEGITSIDAYDRELARRGYSDDNRRILVALLKGRIDDAAAAAAAKAAADARAKARGVSLADMERAVRLGLRTPADLAALLDAVDTPDVEKGLILDLLQSDMQRDADAAGKRAAADAAAKAKAINLPLRRRAVLAGVRSRDDYVQDLIDAGVSLENRSLELQLLDVEIGDAAAAAARRAAIEADRAAKEAAAAEPTLTLAQTEHAVKLGVLAPDDLRSFLTSRGYDPADVETLVASVVAEIPDLRTASSSTAADTTAASAKGIDLPSLERAVLRGIRSVDDYAAELTRAGFTPDAVTLRSQLLREKVGVDLDALRKKLTTALATVDGGPTVAEIDDAIRTGAVDDKSTEDFLISIGVARDVALVYSRLIRLVDDRG